MTLASLLLIATLLLPLSEIGLALFRRARRGTTTAADQGSLMMLWVVILASLAAAFLMRGIEAGRMPFSAAPIQVVAVVLLLVGLVLRWAAILTLGRFFTVDVAVHSDHQIVQTGLYRFIRHPSYTGLLIAFTGLGVALGSWISLAVLVSPIFIALHRRVAVEERALHGVFGAEYDTYCKKTARLLPGIY